MPNTGIDNSQTLQQITAKHCIKSKPNTATDYSQTLQKVLKTFGDTNLLSYLCIKFNRQ